MHLDLSDSRNAGLDISVMNDDGSKSGLPWQWWTAVPGHWRTGFSDLKQHTKTKRPLKQLADGFLRLWVRLRIKRRCRAQPALRHPVMRRPQPCAKSCYTQQRLVSRCCAILLTEQLQLLQSATQIYFFSTSKTVPSTSLFPSYADAAFPVV